ncbi:histidinol-phosphate transaminase [Paraburkholderia sp.]|uniref:histidinol-phosphate transaminase n=1 Tax=Paraburkholderia sp. TaxID=1926495 RepID=UPI003C7DA57B
MAQHQYGPAYVRAMTPYIAGRPISEVARELGLEVHRIVKLASNENPLGVPDSARRAMADAAGDLGRYPDPNAFDLKKALVERYGVPADQITIGSGSNDILELAARSLVEKKQSIVYSQYSFATYAIATQALDARSVVVPAVAFGNDLDGMLRAIDQDTRLVFIANPNNPTGTFIDGPRLEAFLADVPKHVVVVLDEAYTEYLPVEKRYDSIAWIERFPNLIVLRTFSKAYGLAGVRVGFAIAQAHLTDLLNRLRQPFNVTMLAQAAAVAALKDDAFIQKTAALNAEGYQLFTAAFEELGLEYVPSHGNFVLVRVGNDDKAGANIATEMLKQGVIVREVANYGLSRWLRITIGLPRENEVCIVALKKALSTYRE